MSNAAERIRAFLTAHQAPGGETWTSNTAVIAVATASNMGEQFRLTEADLEVLLQTLEILSEVAKVQAEHNPPLVISRASLAEVWEAGARSLPGEPNPYREET